MHNKAAKQTQQSRGEMSDGCYKNLRGSSPPCALPDNTKHSLYLSAQITESPVILCQVVFFFNWQIVLEDLWSNVMEQMRRVDADFDFVV